MGIVAAFALSIVQEVGRGDSFAGYLATSFFVVGGVTALTVGRRIDRIGARRSALLAGAVTSFVALPALAFAHGPVLMIAACGVAGGAFAITLPATNAVLSAVTPTDRIILAVCIKQAAIPLALMLASMLAPLGGRHLAFVAADALSLLALFAFAWVTSGAPSEHRQAPDPGTPGARLARYSLATMLAFMLAGSLIGYAAVSLARAGVAASTVANILLLGNVGGIAARAPSGWFAQRLSLKNWWPVTAMMLAGGLGALGLATHRPAVTVVGCLAAFALGWGWSGLTSRWF